MKPNFNDFLKRSLKVPKYHGLMKKAMIKLQTVNPIPTEIIKKPVLYGVMDMNVHPIAIQNNRIINTFSLITVS